MNDFCTGAVLDCRFKKQWIPISGYSEAAILKAVKMELETRYRCCRKLVKIFNLVPSFCAHFNDVR